MQSTTWSVNTVLTQYMRHYLWYISNNWCQMSGVCDYVNLNNHVELV